MVTTSKASNGQVKNFAKRFCLTQLQKQSFISRKISLSEPLNSTLSTLLILEDKNEQNDKVLIDEDKVKTILDYKGKAAD